MAVNRLLAGYIDEVGGIVRLGGATLARTFRPPLERQLWMEQLFNVGFRSLTITSITLLFTGMVLAIQTAYSLAAYGGKGFVGAARGLRVE